ncbi:hypothetical protein BC937DRAFT_90933 [Endogone sp. FLAS-F59071]|nr:hypothetical protein BC937DRAFT_90933 [Endogone sp. FLAS-F59071]|eukprot:RUS16677.1 hypothetical protein BC937DRAFT_90933 [Endogone sp. FLAS-F59071]
MPTPSTHSTQQQPQTPTTAADSRCQLTDYLHCNNCFLLYSSSRPPHDDRFYLTECSHILCSSCLKAGGSHQAAGDGAAAVSTDTAFTALCPLCQDRYAFAELNDKAERGMTIRYERQTHLVLSKAGYFQRYKLLIVYTLHPHDIVIRSFPRT